MFKMLKYAFVCMYAHMHMCAHMQYLQDSIIFCQSYNLKATSVFPLTLKKASDYLPLQLAITCLGKM